MKKHLLTTIALLCTLFLPGKANAAPAHAEYHNVDAVGAWENAGMNPETLWFTVSFSRANTFHQETAAYPDLEYSFVYSHNNGVTAPPDNNWVTGPDQTTRDQIEGEFGQRAATVHDDASWLGTALISLAYFQNGISRLTEQTGFWKGWPESVCYGLWGAGAAGATGTAKYTFMKCNAAGVYQSQGNSTTTFNWPADAFTSDELDGSSLPEGTSTYTTYWEHP